MESCFGTLYISASEELSKTIYATLQGTGEEEGKTLERKHTVHLSQRELENLDIFSRIIMESEVVPSFPTVKAGKRFDKHHLLSHGLSISHAHHNKNYHNHEAKSGRAQGSSAFCCCVSHISKRIIT